MRVFLVNLRKNPERLERSSLRLKALGVEFERVEAVYGKDLAKDEKHAAVNRFRWWCAQGRKIRDGEIGCALSHFKIYRQMQEEGIECACILEDDNIYSDEFGTVLDQVGKLIDSSRPQVVLLSNYTDPVTVSNEVRIASTRNDYTTASYIITRLAAKALLKANFPIQVPCDYWRRWVSRDIILLYHSIPTVCKQEDRKIYGSDVETSDMERVSEYGLLKWISHKIKRAIGVVIDRLLPL